MEKIPEGIVTFLFTDIEGSTKLDVKSGESLDEILKLHNSILNKVVESNNGFIFKTVGDEFCCSFEKTEDAIKSAVGVQKKIAEEIPADINLKVRMGIHRGKAEWKGSDYLGYITLAGTSRIMSAANGGQILISDASVISSDQSGANGYSFRDLGERRLKDLSEPMRLYQIVSPDLQSDFPPLKTLDVRPNNLPAQLTNFIGRENEIKELKKLLQNSRLITLLGPGGTGKTRLALQTGADIIDEFENGVWIVELASLSDPSLLSNAVGLALNLKEEGGRKYIDIISDYITGKELLLILDNCEHMIGECAVISNLLLNKCPRLKIIISSREAPRIYGEKIFQVPTLSMPGISRNITPESVTEYEAVRLFIDRAVAVKTDFQVNNDNAPVLAELCYHLDGIPLAIELAAARIKIFTLEKILDNLSNRFRLLTGGSRTALPRQKTLRALIDWSYDLLSDKEKSLFGKLSVFSGGWNIEAAEYICSGDEIEESEVLDLISNLKDKSIIISKEVNGGIRLNMLETIRHYSMEKLISGNEISKKHFDYFLNLSEGNDKNNDEVSDILYDREMETEQDNLRSAIKWSLENIPEQSSELIIKVAEYWENKGNYTEAFEALKKVLNLNVEIKAEDRASILLNAAFFACNLDENEVAENYLKQGLEYFINTDNYKRTAEGLSVYGMISFVKGDFDNAIKYSEDGLKLIEGKNEKLLEANVKGNLAAYYAGSGDLENSFKFVDEAITLYRGLNKKAHLAKLLISKGGIYFQSGDLGNAKSCYEEGLPILEEVRDQFSVANTLYNLGNLNFAQKKFEESVSFYNAAATMSKEHGLKNIYDRSMIKLGEVALHQNENEKARKIFVECLKSFHPDSEKLKLNLSIYGLGNYYYSEKNYELSARLFLIAGRINEIIKFKFSKSRNEENENIIRALKKELTENRFNKIYEEVLTLNLDNVAGTVLGLCDAE